MNNKTIIILKKLKIELPYVLVIPILDICPRNLSEDTIETPVLRDGGGNLTNVQYKLIRNCQNKKKS
jgi:hypothetical protein